MVSHQSLSMISNSQASELSLCFKLGVHDHELMSSAAGAGRLSKHNQAAVIKKKALPEGVVCS